MAHLGEQRQAIAPQRRIFGIDHDTVEESVDRGTQRRKARERRAVVAFRQCALDLRDDAGERFVQRLLGRLEQCGDIDRAGAPRSAFLRMFAMRLFAAVRLPASGSARNFASAASRAPKSSGDTGELARTASNISVVTSATPPALPLSRKYARRRSTM